MGKQQHCSAHSHFDEFGLVRTRFDEALCNACAPTIDRQDLWSTLAALEQPCVRCIARRDASAQHYCWKTTQNQPNRTIVRTTSTEQRCSWRRRSPAQRHSRGTQGVLKVLKGYLRYSRAALGAAALPSAPERSVRQHSTALLLEHSPSAVTATRAAQRGPQRVLLSIARG